MSLAEKYNIEIDIRHRAIIDALPVHNAEKTVLNVGSGTCKLDLHMIGCGYDVYSTDYELNERFQSRMKPFKHELKFSIANIFDLSTFPKQQFETVICSEVLEHLPGWQLAFQNLLNLASRRVIITVPWRRSYDVPNLPPPEGHVNYWSDEQGNFEYKFIGEFAQIAQPYLTTFSKILTKKKDLEYGARDYLIVIDKLQDFSR